MWHDGLLNEKILKPKKADLKESCSPMAAQICLGDQAGPLKYIRAAFRPHLYFKLAF